MTPATVSKANWAVEIDRNDADPPEYYAVLQLRADGDQFELLTADGQRVVFDRDTIRKILVMRASAKTQKKS